jgi:proteasome lid subunit RPN8/RPN11
MENAAHSPLRFEVDPREVMRVLDEIDAAGLEVCALYHSHTRTAPYPSQTDVTYAEAWPGTPWIIVGVAGDEAEVRTYLIDGAEVREL